MPEQLEAHDGKGEKSTAHAPADHHHQQQQQQRRRHGVDTVLTSPAGQVLYPQTIPPATQPPEHSAELGARNQSRQDTHAHTPSPPVPPTVIARATTASHLECPRRPPPRADWQTELRGRGVNERLSAGLLSRPRTSRLARAIERGRQEDDVASTSVSSGDEHALDAPASSSHRGLPKRRVVHPGPRQQDSPGRRRQDRGPGPADHRFSVGNQDYFTTGTVRRDGRLRITVDQSANSGYVAKTLSSAVSKGVAQTVTPSQPSGTRHSSSCVAPAHLSPPPPRLNIVLMVIGSRGDAQPFLKIGKTLHEDYGHRVRIATHPTFRDFVERDSGLEFFSVGGDPSELMAFMVKNPGLIPTLESVKAGDISRRRVAMREMFEGFWRACTNATDNDKDVQNRGMMGAKDPFVADAIIANPPSFAHMHCAEALGIPLHLMFTFPYTPTHAFPHPLASIKRSNVDPGYTNFVSYPLVEMMVWQGLGDIVNDFRVNTLALDPVSTLWAPGATYRMHVPFTYLWSPGLVPKPQDWGNEIGVSGFVFLDLASSYQPPQELADFLDAGEAPIYIGFGSIVVDDAGDFTQMIFDAVQMAGVRALVSKGWGGLGDDEVPDDIFMLDNTPHDWLFPRVKACVIHGGAGTTAIALRCGRPTMIVPFFGDQYFWAARVASSGAGPEAVPHKRLNAEKLTEGIRYCLSPEARDAAQGLADSIQREGDGAANAARIFHEHLGFDGTDSMRCSILHDKCAVWQPRGTHIKLSALAADVLVGAGCVTWKQLRLLRHTEWNDFEGPGEPVTGIAGSVAGTIENAFRGVGGVPYRMAKTASRRRRKTKKAKASKRGEDARGGGADMPDTGPSGHGCVAIHRSDDMVAEMADGLRQTASAIAKAPVDLSLALAQGFHNAPRLYGDDTVRRPPRVTGIRSGFRAARRELGYGVYDGWTGVVTQPVRGARSGGVLGFAKGTGIGLSGFVLKNMSALFGPIGYTLKGVAKQAERSRAPRQFVRRARIMQGGREAHSFCGEKQKALHDEVIEGWEVMDALGRAIQNLQKKSGMTGQINMAFVDMAFMFENVKVARLSLRALERGVEPHQVVAQRQRNSGH